MDNESTPRPERPRSGAPQEPASSGAEKASTASGSGVQPDQQDEMGIKIWATNIDVYMKYVTLYFTAGAGAIAALSFGLKTIIVDPTPFSTKVGLVLFLDSLSLLAIYGITRIRQRAYDFADSIDALEQRLSTRTHLSPYFSKLPGLAVMKLLINLGIGLAILVTVFLGTLTVLMLLRIVVFPEGVAETVTRFHGVI